MSATSHLLYVVHMWELTCRGISRKNKHALRRGRDAVKTLKARWMSAPDSAASS